LVNSRPLNTQNKQIISLKEARKLIGKDGQYLTDDDLMGLIIQMQQIASSMIDSALVPNNEEV
jgi:hypothetical protein